MHLENQKLKQVTKSTEFASLLHKLKMEHVWLIRFLANNCHEISAQDLYIQLNKMEFILLIKRSISVKKSFQTLTISACE